MSKLKPRPSRNHLGHPRRDRTRRSRAFRPALGSLEIRTLLSAADVLTYHNDNLGTGLYTAETSLTPENVNPATFGKIGSVLVDGQIYAQPLYKTAVNISVGAEPGLHDVVFVATEHDSVYAIDAKTGAVLWQNAYVDTAKGITTVPAPKDVSTTDLNPEIGITGTPVIDASSNTIYFVTKTKEVRGTDKHYVQTLHALDLGSGAERPGGPVVIADTIWNGGETYTYVSGPTVNGTGDGSINGKVPFNALREFQRPGLTLAGGRVYISWASHGDNGPYHGWLLGYDAATLELKAAFNATPNGGLGGIWMSGGKISVDDAGYLYFQTGNGTFDETLDANGFPINGNYGDTFLKLAVDPTTDAAHQNKNGWGLKVVDYFTPYNQLALSNADADLGSGGVLLLPDSAGGAAHPHLLIAAGKKAKLYLIDRDNMGKFDRTADHVVQTISSIVHGSLDTPAYLNNTIYYVGGYGDYGRAFHIANGVIDPTPTSQTPDYFGFPGSTPSLSSNNGSDAVVWDFDRNTNQLRAYNALDYGDELYTSAQAANDRDRLGRVIKFSVPTIAGGQVYAGTYDSLAIYGLLDIPDTVPAAPSNLTARALSGGEVTLNWTDNATNEDGFYIELATDGNNFTRLDDVLPPDSTSYTVGDLAPATTYTFRVFAFNGQGDSAASNTATATTVAAAGGSGIDYSSGFAGLGSELTLNGVAYVAGDRLRLTDDQSLQTGSAFTTDRLDITKFSTNFTFQLDDISKVGADGFTFAIQGVAPTAIGQSGGGLGYAGLGGSVAVKFDLYSNNGEGKNSTGLYLNGAYPSSSAINLNGTGIDLHSRHVFVVDAAYEGGTLSVTITDTATAASASQSYVVDISQQVGGPLAYVGFTAATGSKIARMEILSWTYSSSAASGLLAPTDLTATPFSAANAILTWQDNSTTETGYRVERKSGSNGFFSTIATLGPDATTFTDSDLDSGVPYTYRVLAFNEMGQSGYSNLAVVITPSIPATPTDAEAVLITATTIDLTWKDNADNEDGYRILRQIPGGTFQQIALLPPSTTFYNDTGLAPSTNYDYHIIAYNSAGYADFAGISVTTKAQAQPLPSPYQDTDIGGPLLEGSASYSDGVFTISGSGEDIGDAADQFHYVYKTRKDNFKIIAYVGLQGDNDDEAKAGVMIRESLVDNSPFAFLYVTAGGVGLETRDALGVTASLHGEVAVAAPTWLKLVRIDDSFSGFVSTDGKSWTLIGADLVAMGRGLNVGMAVTSHEDDAVSVATFDHVNVGAPVYDTTRAIDSGGGADLRFQADVAAEGGNIEIKTQSIDTSGVVNPAPQSVYQSERWGTFTYTIPGLEPGATYTVRLHFAEIYFTQPGERKFNVAINGSQVLDDFDIVAEAGAPNKAIVRNFLATADANGQITIAYTKGSADEPKSSGVEVIEDSALATLQISPSNLVYNPQSSLYEGTLTLTNTSNKSVKGPIGIAFLGLPAGVDLANASGVNAAGDPYFVADLATLAKGGSTKVTVKFRNPKAVPISYSNLVYAAR